MDIFFLPPEYLVTAAISGLLIGILFFKTLQTNLLVSAGWIFGVFAIGQLTFRVLADDQPERLVGQVIYLYLFLLSVWIGKYIRNKF